MDWRLFLSFFVQISVDILSALILIQVLMSWVVGPGSRFFEFINSLVNPLLKPIKNALPKTGMIDFSPMIALLLLELIKNLALQFLV